MLVSAVFESLWIRKTLSVIICTTYSNKKCDKLTLTLESREEPNGRLWNKGDVLVNSETVD